VKIPTIAKFLKYEREGFRSSEDDILKVWKAFSGQGSNIMFLFYMGESQKL
jgi:hypothetical protein